MEEIVKKKPVKKAVISYGVKQMQSWKFEENNFPGAWGKHLGTIPKRFLMYIDGDAGHGKTEYEIQLAKMLAAHFGKVRINNVEQGKHVQIQQSSVRNELHTLPAGKFVFCSVNDFDVMVADLKKVNRGRVSIIDSISYFPLTTAQVQELIKLFPNKSFVFIAYLAHYQQYRAVRHLCDIKVRVEDFVATVQANRFGGGEPFNIWPDRKQKNGSQLPLISN
jgi:hypothetical protein